jgi:hypothetical protein
MSRHRSKLVHAAVALVLLAIGAVLWPSLGASATYAACIPTNNVCITNNPTVVLTLNGIDQTIPYNLNFTLNSGSSSWHATITSTQFTKAGTPVRTLPKTASSVTGVTTVPTCSGSSCPINGITYPVGVPAGNPAPSPVSFYNQTGGGSHGVGTFNIQATINVTVPANAYAGTYTSTITIALVIGSP